MFTINGKQITLSSNDTLDNLKGKISMALNTLPELLVNLPEKFIKGEHYTIGNPIFFMDEIDAIHIREQTFWKEVSKVNLDHNFLKKLYIISRIQSFIEDFGFGNSNQAIQYALFDLQNELGEFDENIWYSKTITIQEFKSMIQENLKKVKTQIQTINIWDSVQPNFQSTSFFMNKINHQTEIPNFNKKTELMVFDAIKLNDIVIACFYKDMIKFNPKYKHLIDDYLQQEWYISTKLKSTDIIRIMITYNIPNSRIKYKTINVFVYKDKITLNIETLINEPSVNSDGQKAPDNIRNIIKNIIFDIGEKEAYNTKTEKEFFYGSFSSLINIPLVILKDLITNDPNVYTISYINESAVINTRKTNLNIFLKGSANMEDVGVSLFERPETVGTFIKIKKIHGGSDLKSRIDVNKKIINKILQYTFDRLNLILKFYQKFVDLKVEINPIKKEKIYKENMLKQEAPEIFLSNYTRLCNKPPIIVEEQDSSQLVLKFPIYGESQPKFYSCPYNDYKYPGLRENTKLKNKNIYPFVPCCYQKPQDQTKNYKRYYEQKVHEQRVNIGEIGKSLKILANERLGTLPPKLDKLLNYKTGIKFYRYGIPLSKSSCLNILNKVTDNQQSEEHIRTELSKRVELCVGEFYPLKIEEISDRIKDKNTYISPRFFKGALEDYYQLTFFLFSKDEDDFSVYPNKFTRFIVPLKNRVILMIEHEAAEHVELIVIEQNKPMFLFEKNDMIIQQIFSLYRERFDYAIYDVKNHNFIEPTRLIVDSSESKQADIFQLYPWEYKDETGKILKRLEPLNQYIDSYGFLRLVEFKYENIKFVGQFRPLPPLKLPTKFLEYFIQINAQLKPEEMESLKFKFSFLDLYITKLDISKSYHEPYFKFIKLKKMAEYILWAACHAYSIQYEKTNISVDRWISNHTQVVEDYTYSMVTIQPIFNLTELMVNGKFIFSSFELQKRIKYNLSLISTTNLKTYVSNVYHHFYNDVSNFKVIYPAQLALTRLDYFQKTREPFKLNILTRDKIKYLRLNTLYFIQDLFEYDSNLLCLFFPSLETLVDTTGKFLKQKITVGENITNITIFGQETIDNYILGTKEPRINIIIIKINNEWFYGLILPELS